MSNKYKTTFFFFLLLIYGSSYSQSNNDTIKFEMKNKDVLIINKQTTDEWDFDGEEEDNDKKILSVELFYGTTGYGEFEDNTFFLVDKQENSATNFFNSYHWGANLLINLCESKNERFYLSTGLGYSVTKYSFVNNMQLQAENGTTTFNLDSADLKSSKLKLNYVQIPLLLGFRIGKLSKNTIGVQIGGEITYRLSTRTITKTSLNNTTQSTRKDNFNTSPINIGSLLRIGIGNIGFFGKVALTPLFKNNNVDYYPFSCGIIIAAF